MGTTVSKVAEFGLNVACDVTSGLLGLSSEGCGVGPFRFSKDRISITLHYGIWNFNLNLGKNENGNYGAEAGVSSLLPGGQCSINIGGDTKGVYGKGSASLDIGSLKCGAEIEANSSEGIHTLRAYGPLASEIQVSKKGLLGRSCGVNVNEDRQVYVNPYDTVRAITSITRNKRSDEENDKENDDKMNDPKYCAWCEGLCRFKYRYINEC